MKLFGVFGLLAVLLLLGACASSITSDVTRFHNLEPPRGETFVVIAQNQAMEGSLELQTYAAEVSNQLRAQGYVPASGQTPDLVVTIDFAISEPLEETYNRRYPYYGYGYFGYGYPYYGYPYYGPSYYGFHGIRHGRYGFYGLSSFYRNRHAYFYDTGYYNRIIYERVFEMAIQKNAGPYVFEGRAVSIGPSENLPKVMPLMIRALFSGFPGENGTTVRVNVKAD